MSGARLVPRALAHLRETGSARNGAPQAGESEHRALLEAHSGELRWRSGGLGKALAHGFHLRVCAAQGVPRPLDGDGPAA